MNTLQRYNLGVDKDAALRYSKSIGKIPESGERDVWSFSQCTDGMHRKCGRTGFKTRNPDEGDGRADDPVSVCALYLSVYPVLWREKIR